MPVAKGSVERGNQALQDRLVKPLRLRGISTIKETNAYAPEFMADFNARFGKEPVVLAILPVPSAKRKDR